MTSYSASYEEAINSTHWWQLKDEVKSRCRSRCEFCWLRSGDDLHHRHYRTVRRERPQDVMLVCGWCHRQIEGVAGWPPWFKVHVCSLAAHGDSGKGLPEPWLRYLEACEAIHAELDTERHLCSRLKSLPQEIAPKDADRLPRSLESTVDAARLAGGGSRRAGRRPESGFRLGRGGEMSISATTKRRGPGLP